jgi:selenocysteine lyase/cysteine desulfurase
MNTNPFWELVSKSIIGKEALIKTPFGERRVTYADYTASGKNVTFIEKYMLQMLELYGNTHTEDGATGSYTTKRFHQAEKIIKKLLNAGANYKIIEVGTGATGAVHRLQQILGIYIPPVAIDNFKQMSAGYFRKEEMDSFNSYLLSKRPVVFVGPYEHHSNEVSWRECYAEVIEIDLDSRGLIDLADLERKVSKAEYRDRFKIGAFSAASNVSGVRTPVYEVAEILHRNNALVFFDYAAIAPYTEINICRDQDSFFDGIYFSPHKFLGGPGSSGILIINERIYRKDLPPTIAAGGTVDFVNLNEQKYNPEIEVREKPGTPGILQTLRAALAMELKEKCNPELIEQKERDYIRRVIKKLVAFPEIEIIGNPDPENRIAVLSFNIKCGASWLHPRFVVTLLNDLFGIQSRAGCSCAGPYGHRVLEINREKSKEFEELIMEGQAGIKPGWARVNFHFLLNEAEVEFICDAIVFIAQNGKYFLKLYEFNLHNGKWHYKGFKEEAITFGLDEALAIKDVKPKTDDKAAPELYLAYMYQADKRARELKSDFNEAEIKTTEANLIPFMYICLYG